MLFDIDLQPQEHLAAIDDCGSKMTYGEIVTLKDHIAEVLSPRELIFCLCENKVESLAGFLVLYDCREVCLLLNASIDKDLLTTLVETYSPSYFWMPESLNSDYEPIFSYKSYILAKTHRVAPELHKDLSMLMTTSGTTGSPKLVRHKYGNIESNAKNVAQVFEWTAHDRGIIDLPMQYTMGLNVITSHLYAGATVLLVSSSLMSPLFWKFIKEYEATNFTGVPFSYEVLHKLRFGRMNLPHLKTMAEGGGKLPDSLFSTFAELAKEKGFRFFATFGTTETSARMAYLPSEDACTHIGSIGKAIPEGNLSIIDDKGSEIREVEQEGELKYEGPNVSMGYATCASDLLKGDEFLGVYCTGDIAKQDRDGYFYIVGRKKRFLKLYGLRVSLDQSEHIINEHFDIQCACIGDDSRMHIYVTDETICSDVKSLISEKTGLMSSSFEVHAIPEIPRLDSGKINYKALK